MSNVTILCVDADESERETTLERLRANVEDATVVPASSLDAAMDEFRERDVDCVVTEYELPDRTGLDLVTEIRNVNPDTGCILHTSTDRHEVAADTPDDVVVEYVDKGAPKAGMRLARLVRATATFHTQTSYPLPQNESDRLAALDAYDLDSAELKADVERITDLAASHFDVPTASINIIDENEQNFLTCYGADWSPTAREDSICTYAILEEDEVTVIEDVTEDPRFEHNDALVELGIRSYMGADLRTPEGLAIGTFCVYDDEPRSFDDEEKEYLRTLAEVTMRLVTLHDAVAESAVGELRGDST